MNNSFLTYAGVLLLLIYSSAFSQPKKVAITIDDIPFQEKKSIPLETTWKTNTDLLSGIHKEHTPVTAFFNGRQCHTIEGLDLLTKWLSDPFVTLGNHTDNHLDHSKTDHDTFVKEVNLVDSIIRPFIGTKPLKYFRFPYNALGKDSIDQADKKAYLDSKNYIITPFTIETADYIFNAVYEHELSLGHKKTADSIILKYLAFSATVIDTMESICAELYGRQVAHIFLCHDVPINADCYHQLIGLFRSRGYTFITLEEALKDPLYNNTNYYHGRYGFSWLYRWIVDQSKRKQYQRREPDPDQDIYHEYERLIIAK